MYYKYRFIEQIDFFQRGNQLKIFMNEQVQRREIKEKKTFKGNLNN
jgi:hypothetical protein